jgi:hypothetical protein
MKVERSLVVLDESPQHGKRIRKAFSTKEQELKKNFSMNLRVFDSAKELKEILDDGKFLKAVRDAFLHERDVRHTQIINILSGSGSDDLHIILFTGDPDPKLVAEYEAEAGKRIIVTAIENIEDRTRIKEYLDKRDLGIFRISSLKHLAALKHRIAHLFLSMDIDLQGIGVLRRQVAEDEIQNAVNTPEAYLRDVLNNKEKTYYRQKLADLQFFVAKVSGGKKKPFLECDGEPSGDRARPTLSESNLPDDKAIVDLIPEEKRNNDSVRLLLNLSGLKAKDAKPFENINPDTNSEIFEFMCLMDCKIEKKRNIREEDVNHVVDFFAKIKGGKGWAVKGANPSPIKCFNDWFCALDDCLEKLRKVIKPD